MPKDKPAGSELHNIANLNKTIHSGARLNIMTILIQQDRASFNYLKKKIGLTDGNLSINLKKLVECGYILDEKHTDQGKSNTLYKLTDQGKLEYEQYLLHIKKLIFQ